MKKTYRVLVASIAFAFVGVSSASAQTPVANFQVGIRIVDPCTMKGKKWEQQCVQLKKQQAQRKALSKAKKPVVKKPATQQPMTVIP